ncbi:hypothetical protein [Phaffia rhodozyma]|uniref:Uncharacterized protein n=1 Tax=Phaffia rhodozyma TaxID=264483 RepID=A0A0F7SEK7_PHARH|nr:hypothetical protein [Phaffia rhodozyma]
MIRWRGGIAQGPGQGEGEGVQQERMNAQYPNEFSPAPPRPWPKATKGLRAPLPAAFLWVFLGSPESYTARPTNTMSILLRSSTTTSLVNPDTPPAAQQTQTNREHAGGHVGSTAFHRLPPSPLLPGDL